ncbi:hypothetical protein ACWEQJ_31225 [Streptomyces cyaneofuscatus]
MTTQYTDQPTGRQHHGAPQRGANSNVFSIIAIVLGLIGFIVLPIVFALAGLAVGGWQGGAHAH